MPLLFQLYLSCPMSSIFLQIGQCGCQIGHQLNKQLSSCYYTTRTHLPKKIHSIMIDTEPKVLKQYIDNPPKWLDPSNVKYFEHGRGNNWSYGYMHELPHLSQEKQKKVSTFVDGHRQFSHLPVRQAEDESQPLYTQFEEKVLLNKYLKENRQICEYGLEKIRKELDTADCATCINVLCSLGGGTGSGLGTKMIEKIYDEFCLDVYAHVILPNKSGQTPLQIYNCSLSLAQIQQNSTAIFTYENDNMVSMFSPPEKLEQPQGDLDYINKQIALVQARLFKINELNGFDSFYNGIVNQCVVSQQMKYLTLFGSGVGDKPGNLSSHFDQCLEIVSKQLRVYNEEEYAIQGISTRRQKCLSNFCLVQSNEKVAIEAHHLKKLKSLMNPISEGDGLNLETVTTKSSKKQDSFHTEILLLMNHSNISRYLEYLLISGRKKYESKAYLWHYKYADLDEAFNQLESTLDQYVYTTQ